MDANKNDVDIDIERSLRPSGMDEYIGQSKAKEQLEIFIKAAKERGEASTMYCCMDLLGWVRPHYPILLQMN